MNEDERNRRTYEAFASAWVAGDVVQLMEYVTEDIGYGASIGPEPGATYSGKAEVERGFRAIMAHDRDRAMVAGEGVYFGGRGYVEWRSGDIRGFDILYFRDGLISRKDAFRKTLG